MIFFCHFFGKSVVFKVKTIGRWFGKNRWYNQPIPIGQCIGRSIGKPMDRSSTSHSSSSPLFQRRDLNPSLAFFDAHVDPTNMGQF